MFSNAQQSIPQRFLDKMTVDKKIAEVLSEKVIRIQDIPVIMAHLEPLREEQAALRQSCEAFIVDRKARGPNAS